jgi:serine/threonine protein kinase
MGEVYRASDPKIGRDVAIKVLPADFLADKDRVARYEDEAQAAGALNHHLDIEEIAMTSPSRKNWDDAVQS